MDRFVLTVPKFLKNIPNWHLMFYNEVKLFKIYSFILNKLNFIFGARLQIYILPK